MYQINIHHAKTHLSKLVEEVALGEEIIIAKAGKPIAKLVPIDKPKPNSRVPGSMKHQIKFADNINQPMCKTELDLWLESSIFPNDDKNSNNQ
ncbi:MAG: type II toxin-antitoxin system Phd/YefM family antitoxin [Methylococcales bacterium]|nr:type II toxin-antitoxin system Phd/YefM family antitoxin [Methylococcales bacterium]